MTDNKMQLIKIIASGKPAKNLTEVLNVSPEKFKKVQEELIRDIVAIDDHDRISEMLTLYSSSKKREASKEAYLKKKDEVIHCSCGAKVKYYAMPSHKKTKKHQKHVESDSASSSSSDSSTGTVVDHEKGPNVEEKFQEWSTQVGKK